MLNQNADSVQLIVYSSSLFIYLRSSLLSLFTPGIQPKYLILNQVG